MKESLTHNDDLLSPWLRTLQMHDLEASDSALSSLIESHITPVIRGVVRFKLRLGPSERSDEDDLIQEALTEWLTEVRKLGNQPDTSSISDARGLAATITYRVCYAWLRRKSPHRHALSNRLQYLLTRQAGFSLWHSTSPGAKFMVAGFTAWRDKALVPAEKLRELPGDERFLTRAGKFISDWQDARLIHLVKLILDTLGGPVPFNDLLNVTVSVLRSEMNHSPQPKPNRKWAELTWRLEKMLHGVSRRASFSNDCGVRSWSFPAHSAWLCSSTCVRRMERVVSLFCLLQALLLSGRLPIRLISRMNDSPRCGEVCPLTTRGLAVCSNSRVNRSLICASQPGNG